jgi:hypothetical protein
LNSFTAASTPKKWIHPSTTKIFAGTRCVTAKNGWMPKTRPHPDSRMADAITTRPRQDKPQRSLRENMPQNLDDEWSDGMVMIKP